MRVDVAIDIRPDLSVLRTGQCCKVLPGGQASSSRYCTVAPPHERAHRSERFGSRLNVDEQHGMLGLSI